MEIEVSGTNPVSMELENKKAEKDRVRVNRKTLEAVLEQCQRALESLSHTGGVGDDDDDDDGVSNDGAEHKDEERNLEGASAVSEDRELDELCDLLKSRVVCSDLLKSRVLCSDLLQKLEFAQGSVPQNIAAEEVGSWDVVSESDLWEGENTDSDQDDYVLVRQEDIVEGIACFMAAYLLTLKQTKDLTPNQLQEALSKTFSIKKKKGKFRKAWDGSKVIYNVASWGATAIGIYQNPVLVRAATKAFWTSCQVISKLL